MIPTFTLLSLACAVVTGQPFDTSEIASKITPRDQAKMEYLVNAGACLPENLETLLGRTKLQMERGELSPMGSRSPSDGCS